ncbi:hypothetical protein YQE_00634, partial [Dendroctonus ponderosae]
HFLIGRKLTSLPQEDLQDVPVGRLTQVQRIQQLAQHFWSRWHREYLGTLQTRSRWKTAQKNVKPGLMVLLKEDNTPPLQWSVGRIKAVHPGRDNIVRVVTVKTSKGEFKRACSRVCPLPIEQ